MPGRTIEPCFVAGVNVAARAPSPALSTRYEFQFDDALRSESHGYFAIQLPLSRRHEDSHARAKCGHHFRTIYDLRTMRRAALLLSFSYQDKVHREFAAGGTHRIQRRDE